MAGAGASECGMMRCYFVLVHGKFVYHVKPAPSGMQHEGVFAARCLFARDEEDARERALCRVKRSLSKYNPDIRDGLISARLEVEEVEPDSWYKAFYRANWGHVFYRENIP
jgi:hypothetical protein